MKKLESTYAARLLHVPAGAFQMGSPESEVGRWYWEQQRTVTLSHEFYLGETLVTQGQYASVMGENPTDFPNIGEDAPVDSVKRDLAKQFCKTLTERDRAAGVLPDDWQYRLPTEAEWEYACRAGTDGARYDVIDDIAWFHENSKLHPHRVAQKAPNAWGFFDMIGNLWELCEDWFHRESGRPAVRGGSYFNTAKSCRAAAREGYDGGRYCGFRLAAAPVAPLELSVSIDDLPSEERPPSIYAAINSDDTELAASILQTDPTALESYDEIPPPLHWCIYNDHPEMLGWLLDAGASIERPEQDHGATPIECAAVMRHTEMIRTLHERGADATNVRDIVLKGLDGAYENFGLDAKGYQAVAKLADELKL